MHTIISAQATIEAIAAALAPITERAGVVAETRAAVTAEREALAARRSAGEDVQELIVARGSHLARLNREAAGLSNLSGELFSALNRIERKGSSGRVWACDKCHHEALVTLRYTWGEGAVCQWCAVAHLIP